MTTELGIDLPTPANGNPDPDPKTTAGAMVAMLRRHYIPDETRPAGIFAPEIQAPGSSGRRADLIWLGVTTASGFELVGHEVKVSRADVCAELADLTKSDPWMRYCDRWWLVVPHLTLIDGLDIPESWGVMLPPSGRRTRSVTVHRKAPKLDPVNQAPALRTIAARVHWRLRDEQFQHDHTRRRVEVLERQNETLAAEGPRTSAPNPEREFVTAVVTKLGGSWDGSTTGGYGGGRITVDDVVTALRDLQSVRSLRRTAEDGLSIATNHLSTVQAIVNRAIADVTNTRKKNRKEPT